MFNYKSVRWIDFLRIFLGLALLYEGIIFLIYHNELFSSFGFIQTEIQRYTYGHTSFEIFDVLFDYSSWDSSRQSIFTRCFLGIYLVFICLMILGIQSRITTILSSFIYIIFINSSTFSIYGVDQYLILYLFYLSLISIFTPIQVRIGLDRGKDKKKFKSHWFSSFIFRMCQFTLALSYINAGIAKSLGNHWWTGESVWRVVNQPNYQQIDISFLGAYPLIFCFVGWMTLLLEIFYPFAILNSKTRWIWVLLIIFMHLGIGVFMGLWFFGSVLIILNICFFILPYYSIGRNLKRIKTANASCIII